MRVIADCWSTVGVSLLEEAVADLKMGNLKSEIGN